MGHRAQVRQLSISCYSCSTTDACSEGYIEQFAPLRRLPLPLHVDLERRTFRIDRKPCENATRFLIDEARADAKLAPLIERIQSVP